MTMNTLELMDSSAASYSKTDRRIYELIRKFPDRHASASISEIAENGHVSKAALTRFAKRLGFVGFAEFQYQLRQDLEQRREGAPTNAEVYGALLPTVEASLDHDQLVALARRFKESPRIFVMGANLSRLPAEELHMALAYTPEVFAVLPPTDVMPNFRPEDTLIIYSAITGGAHADFVKGPSAHPEKRPHMVLITTNSKHPLRRHFDEIIVLPTATLSSGTHAVLSDTFAFLIFNDALVSLLEGDGE
jgi:DNA-binding MurR/RpiR family transcriptional regulator